MDKLLEVISHNWLKKKSIPIACILLIVLFISLVTSVSSWNGISIEGIQYVYWAIPFTIVLLVYSFACLCYDRLPKASKGSLAVLFCIDAESDKLYEAAKFKLVGEFRASLIGDGKSRFDVHCVQRKKVSKYQPDTKEGALALLLKTNCVLVVFVRYTADDITNAENFELRIDYGVRHPEFNEEASAVLSHDLATIKEPVGKQRFVKSNTISIFSFTAQTLTCACQYILGFVYLLAGDNGNALALLLMAREKLVTEHSQILGADVMRELVDDRLYATLGQIAVDHLKRFQKYKKTASLQEMRRFLEMANAIRPNTFFYNLNMAYVHIALNHDETSAQRCISKCKQSKEENKWVYSDAFLSAYCGYPPGTIISKYKNAFTIPYTSLVEIVEYIEYILSQEPSKTELHLAAGLVYEEMGDIKLMKYHLSTYLSLASGLERRIRSQLTTKIQQQRCNDSCQKQCTSCVDCA